MTALPSKPSTPLLLGFLVTGLVGTATVPALAAPQLWSPAPVNQCGEQGFDPLARLPLPSEPRPPLLLPEKIELFYPLPELTFVPVHEPPPPQVRVAADPLPADPCGDPCPDLREPAAPGAQGEPATPGEHGQGADAGEDGAYSGEPARDVSGGAGTGSAETGSSMGSGSVFGIELPRLEVRPQIEPIPIPIPGGPRPDPQPAPPAMSPDVEPGPLAPAPTAPAVGGTELVGQVTGHGSLNRTDVRWRVHGTDLGIMWESRPGEVAVAFGDTFGEGWTYGGAGGSDWRSNVLGFSADTDLSDGLTIDSMIQDDRCHAAELLSSRKIKNYETTVIPTSGFALDGRQYMSYMSVRRWSAVPGLWYTNHGGIAWSDDNGSTWTKDQHARWDNLFGLGRFQVTAMVPHGDHVYMFGTPNGRVGVTGLARVPKEHVLNKSAYQYWVDGTWRPAAESDATPLFLGIASELSVRYDEQTGRWQMTYLDSVRGAIVLREATSPQGAWSEAVPVLYTADYPKAYGGFIHPWSSGGDLYFTMSAWDSYNVYLMRARLLGR
ncbi:MAG TPA: DUF4185 domain-containing protein [Nocardia sp.]|uniref:DUF4185 domain-containing protein n=1 Tax=Nocardia sp. TaxID=1821 RepID=UPI002B4B3B4A|nr:DUF4185 domain-containing protein [Nocardia sp.]HLS77205.1 DUF4185 domain-containing protein [Nocardia sp.]